MNIKIKKNRLLEVIGVILYLMILDIIYIFLIQNNVNYWGFDLKLNFLKIIESFLLALCMYVLLPKNQNRISTYIMQIQYITIYIPLVSLYGMEDKHRIYVYLVTSIFVIMFTALKKNIKTNIKTIKVKRKFLYLSLFIVIGITILGLFKSGLHPYLKSFDFSNVYTIRKVINLDSVTGYLIGITVRVITPFLLCIGLKNKNYKVVISLICIQLFIYSMYPQKSILFSSLLVIGCLYILKKKNFFLNVIYGFIIICIISIVVNVFLNDDVVVSLFVRRVLFVPVNIQFDYYDFFINHKYLYMSNNLIGNILGIEYIYSMPIVHLIASIYYGQPNMAANTCYIADSYAQLGYLGMLIYASIFIWINRILDWINIKVDKLIIIPTLIFSIYALNDASLLTTMITHGLVPGIIILYLYMGERENN